MNDVNKESEEWTLTLLHTNDAHGHLSPIPISSFDLSSQLYFCHPMPPYKEVGGFAYLASVVEQIRNRNENVLLVDAGDTFFDTEIANVTKGQLHARLMNELGYGAMVPGNHEIDYGIDELKKLANKTSFPILAANLIANQTQSPLLGKPYTFKTFKKIKVGIYSLTYHLTHETTSDQNIEVYLFCLT